MSFQLLREVPLFVAIFIISNATFARSVWADTVEATYLLNGNLNAQQGGVAPLTSVDPDGVNTFVSDTVFGKSQTVFQYGGATDPADQGGLSVNTSAILP